MSYFDLKMPTLGDDYAFYPEFIHVTPSSPLKLRKAVERIAYYFRREGGFDFVQYSATEDDQRRQAYLWLPKRWIKYPRPVVGACCFRWREYTQEEPAWALQWIWLHPYQRGQGLLMDAWPYFKQEYGDFSVEPPLSGAMEGFLKKVGYCLEIAND